MTATAATTATPEPTKSTVHPFNPGTPVLESYSLNSDVEVHCERRDLGGVGSKVCDLTFVGNGLGISIALVTIDQLRELAVFLAECADELDEIGPQLEFDPETLWSVG